MNPVRKPLEPVGAHRATKVEFHTSSSGVVGGDPSGDLLQRIAEAFLPFHPVQRVESFAGRTALLNQLVSALEEYRSHVVICGSSGAGKTSLAMTLSRIAERSGYLAFYVPRSRNSTLRSILEPVLSRLPLRYDVAYDRPATQPAATFADLLPEGEVTPPEMSQILSRISGTRLVIVVDELKPSQSGETESDVVELMKLLSDQNAPVHLIAIGVARSADELFGTEVDLPRSLFEVRLGFMTDAEMTEALQLAAQQSGLAMASPVVAFIVRVAYGKPFIGKVVGMAAAKAAALRVSDTITEADLQEGLTELRQRIDSMSAGRWRAIASNPDLFAILGAAALAARGTVGDFTVEGILTVLRSTYGADADRADVMHQLERLTAGPDKLLDDVSDGRRERFQFVSPQTELCIALFGAQPRR